MDKIADLKKLKTLFEEGFLTKYEFDYLKDELLGNKSKTAQEIPQLKNKDVIDNDKKGDVVVSNHQPKTKIVYEAKQIACAQCKKQITLSQSKDNKGLCNQCVKSKKTNNKWFLLLLLLIPIAWWIFKDSSSEEVPSLVEPSQSILDNSSNDSNNNFENENNKLKTFSYPNENNKVGYIKGTDIIIREGPSSLSKILGSFKLGGEKVTILDEMEVNNKTQAILIEDVEIYDGNIFMTWSKGKSLEIISRKGDSYIVSDAQLKVKCEIPMEYVELMSDKWYKIERKTGEIGWVFWKFISFKE